MKKTFLTLSALLLTFSSAQAACTKAEAKKAVEHICSEVEAKGAKAKASVQKYRYCGTNYVWIQDKDVKMVLHPIKRRLNGKSLKKSKDDNGLHLFVEFDKMANSKAEGGWVDYVWPKPGAEKATAKTSFIKKCGGALGWIAGSGIWK